MPHSSTTKRSPGREFCMPHSSTTKRSPDRELCMPHSSTTKRSPGRELCMPHSSTTKRSPGRELSCPTAAQLKDPLVSDDMFALMENTKIISGYRTDYSAIVFLFFNIPCQTWQGILEI